MGVYIKHQCGVALVIFLSVFIWDTALANADTKCGRDWKETAVFPEDTYMQFLETPKNNVGFIDILLKRSLPEDGQIIMMVDIRDETAVCFFRGIPGGNGFAIPETWPYLYREYILEIRWFDQKNRVWKYWWNKNKLDATLLKRPTLCPLAENMPF